MATIREINLNIPVLATSNPVEEAVVESIKELMGTESFYKSEYIVPDTETEDLAIDVLVSDREDELIVLSTFGAGSLATKGKINIDNQGEVEYRTEFYALANNSSDSIILGEVIAKLAFIVSKNDEAFFPGMVIAGVSPTGHESLTHTLIAPMPIGVREDIRVAPVSADAEFAICWVNAIPVTQEEADLISAGPEGFKQFEEFLAAMGDNAYSLSRPTYIQE